CARAPITAAGLFDYW
nr:immunoglobulin heavy chain junction region [Macaca mulatta]MOV47214.1 immunoglobulin heavy chain junction region [Macaca mulatta]